MVDTYDQSGLPRQVMVREEGPRDGWQNIDYAVIPTPTKLHFIEGLVDAGFRRITLTSMVHPKWVPQLADAEAVLRGVERRPDVSYSVLVPNGIGFDRVRKLRDEGVQVDEITFVVSATEAHNRANLNQSVDESMTEFERMFAIARSEGIRVIAGLACVFGCSYEGRVPEAVVSHLCRRLTDLGAEELVLGDTTGMANPRQVAELLPRLAEATDAELTLHLHNTRGLGLANCLAALQIGIASFESSFGELGGCQFARGATGNIASEDLLGMLSEMGIAHGVNLRAVIELAREMESILGRRLDGHLLHAGQVDWSGRSAASTS